MARVLNLHEVQSKAVEIDPEVVRIAREYFHHEGEVIVADGRLAIETSTETYDICVIDTYSGDAFPFHLASVEMWKAVDRVLGQKGVLGINYIGVPGDEATASMLRTVREVFKNVRAFRNERGDAPQTITILASNRDLELDARRWLSHVDAYDGVDPVSSALARLEINLPKEEGHILTDNHNPIDLERARSAVAWRKKTADILGSQAVLW